METFGTLYIVCGIIYTIACITDGQDVKPLWKRWVGKNLEKASNYFFPIKYVTETKVVKEYVPVPSPTPWQRCDYDHLTFDAVKVQSNAMITESDLMMAFMHTHYQKKDVVELLINENKSKCFNAIFRKIAAEDVVNFDVDKETARPNILVRAWLYVGKKR